MREILKMMNLMDMENIQVKNIIIMEIFHAGKNAEKEKK